MATLNLPQYKFVEGDRDWYKTHNDFTDAMELVHADINQKYNTIYTASGMVGLGDAADYIDQEILNISNQQTLDVSPTAEYTHLYDALTEIKNRGRGIYRINCNAGDIYQLNASTPNLVFAPGTSVYIVKSGSGDNPKMVNNHYNQSSYSVPAGRLRGLDLSIILWNIEYKSIKATLPQHAAYGWVNSEWGGKTETSIYYGNIDLDIDTFLVSTYVMSKLTIVSHGYNKLKGGGKLINNYGGLSNIIHTAWSLTVENNSKILTSLNTNTLGLSTNLLTSSEVLV